MKKDSRPYLTHDLGARNDPKLMQLVYRMGGLGKAIWWDLVEMLWEQEGYIPLDFEILAYDLRYCKAEDIERVVLEFGLFENDGEHFWNVSALARIQHKVNTSEQRRNAGKAGGEANRKQKLSKDEANANQMLPEVNTKDEANSNQLINKLINKLNKDNIFLLRAYARKGEEEKKEIEIFHAIFFFEKNCRNAANETARFIAHYSPQNWTHNGQPITDKLTLARKWAVADPRDKAFKDDRPLTYLREVYISLRRAGHPDRWQLFDQVKDMRADATAEGVAYSYRCSAEARALIEGAGLSYEGVTVRFA